MKTDDRRDACASTQDQAVKVPGQQQVYNHLTTPERGPDLRAGPLQQCRERVPVDRPGALPDNPAHLERQTGDVVGDCFDCGVDPGELPKRRHGRHNWVRLLYAVVCAV